MVGTLAILHYIPIVVRHRRMGSTVIAHGRRRARLCCGGIRHAVPVRVNRNAVRSGEGRSYVIQHRDHLYGIIGGRIAASIHHMPYTIEVVGTFAILHQIPVEIGHNRMSRTVIVYRGGTRNRGVRIGLTILILISSVRIRHCEYRLCTIRHGNDLDLFRSIATGIRESPSTFPNLLAFASIRWGDCNIFILRIKTSRTVVGFVGHIASVCYRLVIVAIIISINGDGVGNRERGLGRIHNRNNLNLVVRIIAAFVGQLPRTFDNHHSLTGTFRGHYCISVGGLDAGGAVVGLIGHIAHHGQVSTIVGAIRFLIDGDIYRLREGRLHSIQHRDGLHLIVGGITAVVHQMPRSLNDLLALAITIRHHIRVGGLEARGAVVGHVGHIAGLCH